MSNTENGRDRHADAVTRMVVATPYGRRYHRLTDGKRPKHAACGGFVQTNLFRLPQSEAVEQGYSACQNCSWPGGEA